MNDVTSFHPDYKHNGPDRENRHKILFRYERNEYPVPSYTPEAWIYNGRIVLDPKNDPVLMWLEIPWVLSSEYEGYDMEVVRRLNPNITFRDFRARMPRFIIKGSTRKNGWGLSTLSMRNTRFRLGACCLAWTNREGSDVLKAYLDEKLPVNCRRANSTEDFRDLTPYEVEEAKDPNKRKFPKRAGKRALDEATRQERDEVEQRRRSRLIVQHEEIIGVAPSPAPVDPAPRIQKQKRKRAESLLDSADEEETTRPSKRQDFAIDVGSKLLGAGSSRDHGFQTQFPVTEEFEIGHGFDDWTFSREVETEHMPLYTEQPAPESFPNPHNNQPRQASAEEPLPDDFRFVRPTNEMEELSIQEALNCTREDCRKRIGVNLDIPSTTWETYAYQYLEIEGFFNQLWPCTLDGQAGEEAPVLPFFEPWGGDFEGWKAQCVFLY